MFSNIKGSFSEELALFLRPLVKLSAEGFKAGLLALGPQQFGGLPLSNLQANVRIGHAMNRVDTAYENDSSCRTLDLEQSAWVTPIGYYYKQNEMEDQCPFNVRTYGFATGYSARFSKHFLLSGGVGYTDSNLNWYSNKGGANIQCVYLTLLLGI